MNARNLRVTGLSLAAAVAMAVWIIGATNTPSVAQSNVPSAVQPAGDAAASTAPAPPATPTAEPSAEPARTYERAARTTSAPAASADVQPAQIAAPVAVPGNPNVYYPGLGLSSPGFGSAEITGSETDAQRQLREESPRLELELGNLLKEYAAAGESARGNLGPRIHSNLVKQFDARQKVRDLEIADLEAQVKRLRDLHQRREAAKSEIVQSRLAQLLRSAEGLGWDGSETDEFGRRFSAGRAMGSGGMGMGQGMGLRPSSR